MSAVWRLRRRSERSEILEAAPERRNPKTTAETMPAQRAPVKPGLGQPDPLQQEPAQQGPAQQELAQQELAQHWELVQRPALRFEIGEYRATT